jgi:ABC-type polysaccharide/polyol phosphate export permease
VKNKPVKQGKMINRKSQFNKAFIDLTGGLAKWNIWVRLSWFAVREKYRRSVLGPFWITLSTAVMVLTFGILYGKLLGENLSEHLPYVACGIVMWLFYSESLVQGCHIFITNGKMIQQLPLPLSVHLYHFISKELIMLAHNFLIILFIFLFYLKGVGFYAIFSLIGLLLIMLNALSIALIFGVISVRFRDFPLIIQSIMRPMMFLTPVIWNTKSFPERSYFIDWNPFYHIVEIFRQPLLGNMPSANSWVIVLLITSISCVMAFALFARYRHRIAYWV